METLRKCLPRRCRHAIQISLVTVIVINIAINDVIYAQTLDMFRTPQVGDTLFADLDKNGLREILLPLHRDRRPYGRNRSWVHSPDSLVILEHNISEGSRVVLSYIPPGPDPSINAIKIGDLDGNGRTDILIDYGADILGVAQGQFDVIEFEDHTEEGWVFSITLSTHPVSRFVELNDGTEWMIIVDRPWWDPGHPPYDSEPEVYPAAILRTNEGGGYCLANDSFNASLGMKVLKHVILYDSLAVEFNKTPTRDLAESLIQSASSVVVWMSTLLDGEKLDHWIQKQVPLFQRMVPFSDSLMTTDRGLYVFQDPVEALEDLHTRGRERIDWIIRTQGKAGNFYAKYPNSEWAEYIKPLQ